MSRLISLGEINKNIIYPILGGLSKLIAEFIIYKSQAEISKHPLILGFSAGFGMFLSIIPYIILKIYSRPIREEKTLKGEKLIYNDPNKVYYRKIRLKKYFFIFLSSFLDFLQKILVFLFTSNINNIFWIFNILFLSLFSRCILNAKLYKYHYLSLIIIIVLGIIINIIKLYDSNSDEIIYIFLSLFIEVIYSLVAVINKYNMEITFSTPYELSFFEGLFILIVNMTLVIICTKNDISEEKYKFIPNKKIYYNGKTYLDNFYDYYDKLNYVEILIFILSLMSRLLFNLFGLITIKNYTPSHIVILLIIGEIQFIFEEKEIWIIILEVIFILIILFMILVFTEIIELNFWGLQIDTKKNIALRAKTEIDNGNEIRETIDELKELNDENEKTESSEEN